jgi:Txe/YoeB family toxin of Txe-Axe toxin-antitoxin module
MSQEEFVDLIKEAEKGPFKPLGSFDEFKNDVLNAWKRKYGK